MEAVEVIKAPVRQPSQWWRWPLIPFASVIGAFLGAAMVDLLNWVSLKMYGGFSANGWMMLYILPVMSSAAFGFIYAWIACSMAPKAKFIAGLVMVSVLGVVSIASIFIYWYSSAYGVGRAIYETLRSIAWMVAAISALAQFYDQ